MIYFVILILTLLFIVLYDKKGQRSGFKAYLLLYLLAVLVSGLRLKLGGDSIRYEDYFDSLILFEPFSVFNEYLFEPGWVGMNMLIKNMGGSFIWVQLLHAFFINTVIFYFIYTYSEHKFTAVLFYFSFAYLYFNTEILRESIAVVLFLLNIKNYQSKSWGRYLLIALISIFFHSSALFTLFLPIVRHVKFKAIYILWIVIGVGVVFNLFYAFSDLFPPYLAKKLDLYSNTSMNVNGTILRTLIYIIIPLILLKFHPKSYNIFSVLYVPYFIVASVSVFNTGIGGRLINYFTIINIAYLSNFLYNLSYYRFRKITPVVRFLLVTLLYVYSWSYYFTDTSYAVQGTVRMQSWFPYTHVLKESDINQQVLIVQREEYIHILMDAQAEIL